MSRAGAGTDRPVATSKEPATHRARGRLHRPPVVVAVVVVVAGLAWLLTVHQHGASGHRHGFDRPLWALASGWVVMVAAMMLPPALPLLLTVAKLVTGRPRPARLVATTAVSFVAVWFVAGALLVAVDLLIGLWRPGLLPDRPGVVAGLAGIVAGVYQLTPLKRACLTACRSPYGVVATTWTGARQWRCAAMIGVRFGVVCVGCCWALMLLTLAVGAASLPVMVVASAVMAAERLLPDVRRLVPMLAVLAILAGLLAAAGLVPGAAVPARAVSTEGHHR